MTNLYLDETDFRVVRARLMDEARSIWLNASQDEQEYHRTLTINGTDTECVKTIFSGLFHERNLAVHWARLDFATRWKLSVEERMPVHYRRGRQVGITVAGALSASDIVTVRKAQRIIAQYYQRNGSKDEYFYVRGIRAGLRVGALLAATMGRGE